MNDKPLVSAIIPCYNSEKWINQSLNSVFNQTYNNIEVIIIDDGSFDRTKSEVNKYKNRVRYFRQENMGPSVARNKGIEMSRGKYIAFLDSDDLWEKEKIEIQVNYMERNTSTHLVFSNVNLINEDGDFLYTHYNNVPGNRNEIIKELFLGKITMNTPTIMVSKEATKSIGGFNENLPLREDHFFMMEIADKFEVYHFMEPLVNRRINEGSMSVNIAVNEIFDKNTPFLEFSIQKFPFLYKYKSKVESSMFISVGKKHWRNNSTQESVGFLYKGVKMNPKQFKNYIFLFMAVTGFKFKWFIKIKGFIKGQQNNKSGHRKY